MTDVSDQISQKPARGLHIKQFAGIHLAGVNSHRTAVVILSGDPLRQSLKLTGLYEKIGHIGNLFSDDRILEILRLHSPLDRLFVDCPLSVPPCVSCVRPTCPGVDACEDVEVAYMQSIAQNISSRQKRRKKSLNPQVQRLWDVYRLSREDSAYFEPTYSSNNANQSVRAQALQKRLDHAGEKYELEETHVALSLKKLSDVIGLDPLELERYRSFSAGKSIREEVVTSLEESKWLRRDDTRRERLFQSVDVFEALICSFVAALADVGLCERSPKDYVKTARWVYRPELSVTWKELH